MDRSNERRAFTIIEVIVVVGILAVVIGLTMSVYSHGVRLSRQTACLSNLRQLAMGLNVYYTEHGQLPADDRPSRLADGLLPFLKDDGVLHCPADPREGAHSYAPYYVQRRELDAAEFVLGCPRHSDGTVATVLYGNAGSEGSKLGTMTHNGSPVYVGDRVSGGTIRFGDGSVASLDDGLSVDLVASFERGDGSYYSIIRLPVGETGAVGLDVNPKSRLEVITPAAIAGSEGTRFYVIQNDPGSVKIRKTKSNGHKDLKVDDHLIVYVKSGKVRVTTRGLLLRARLLEAKDCVFFETPNGALNDCLPPTGNYLPVLPGDPVGSYG